MVWKVSKVVDRGEWLSVMSVGTPYISGLNFIFERLFVNVNAINLNEKSFSFTFYDSVNLPKNINSLQNKKNKNYFY